MTPKHLKTIFNLHNFMTLATESDYEQISKKALRLSKKINKLNHKLVLEIDKKCEEIGMWK